jgi:phosphogluconate dehydratase
MHPTVAKVTARVVERSRKARAAYLTKICAWGRDNPNRGTLSCGNLAHGFAGAPQDDKFVIRALRNPNIGIVSAYNDMLSAHQPFERFPQLI